MKLIVAVDREWGIGFRGDLLARVRADLQNFRSLTQGKVVVLGSKTLSTFPQGKPLKNRINIVMSRNPAYPSDVITVCHSVDELLAAVETYPSQDVFVIGGASVYEQLLPYCDTAYVTFFDKSFEKDAYFPNLDERTDWMRVSESERMESDPETDSEGGLGFVFTEYKRI